MKWTLPANKIALLTMTSRRADPNRPSRRLVPLLGPLILLSSACGGGEGLPPVDPNLPEVSIQDVVEEHLTVPVAVVNGVEIYRATYEQLLNFLRGQIEADGAESVERYIKARSDALERAIDMELLFQEAVRHGYELKPEEVRREYARKVAGSPSEAAYLKTASGHLFSKSEVLDGIRRELSVNRFIEGEISSRMSATEVELREYYVQNQRPFTTEKKVRVGSIFIASPQGGTAAERASGLTRISQALERLKKGDSFERVAREMSEDEVAQMGGRLGTIRRGFLPRDLDLVAFSLKPGEISTIIETEAGFHLLKVSSVVGGELRPFEDVQDKVRDSVLARKKTERLNSIIKGLRNGAEISRQLS